MSIAKFSVKNPVLVNFLMIALFFIGGWSLIALPTELNPRIPFNWVFITIPYPGAAPAEVESLIIDPIESEIADIDDIDEILSTSGDGFGFIQVKFKDISDSEFRERYVDLKAEIDKVDIPDEAEDPVVDDFSSEDFMPVISVNMLFSIPEDNAQQIAEEIEEDLKDLPGIKKLAVSGLAKREIWIEVDPVKMNALHVTFDEIIAAIKMRNLNVPGGNISFGKTEYTLRAIGEYKNMDEIKNTVIKTSEHGHFVKVEDVAEVNDTREEMTILSRIDMEKAVTFSVSKKSDYNSIDVINNVKALVKEYENKVQDGVSFTLTFDSSVYINRIIGILMNNAVTGIILIAVLLYVFLGGYNAILAMLGIPISFFISFIFLNLSGYTFNGSTLFALVMVLGIIVDDAIIVLENSHRYRLMGYSAKDSAIKGTNEVIKPIISSIATNIVAFLPLILLPGIVGKFMRIIPIVFSLALLASMFEAFILLPSHYADWTVKSGVYNRGEKKFFKVLRRYYESILFKVLRLRYAVLIVLIILLPVGVTLTISMVGVNMFGEDEFDQCSILIKMPEGTSLEETDRVISKYEELAHTLPKEEVKDIITNVGLLQGNDDWQTKKSVGQILLQLQPAEVRTLTADDILKMLRDKSQDISGPISASFEKLSGGPPQDKEISIKVQGKYFEDIKRAALMLQDSIKSVEGTFSIADDFPPGKDEINIRVNDEKAALYGFNTQYIALIVRYAFDGVEATEYRDGDDEIDVIVKYKKEYRSSIEDVLNLKITNLQGQTAALRDIVTVNVEPGNSEMKRFDQERTILVTGELDQNVTPLNEANIKIAKFFPAIEQQVPGVRFKVGGQFAEFMSIFQDIGTLLFISLLLIFLILGTQFNSYTLPLVILTTVPFALLGAMLGLIISQNPFGIVSMFGFVALAGIVVNDAIVMLSFYASRRKEGEEAGIINCWRSIIDAGRLRLRPIILTSVTTISGLVPMAFGIGGMSETWSPLANTILFGLMVATLLTLFVIPALIVILDDIKGVRKKIRIK